MPGVPPDALAQVKRSFKGLFKRNKQKTSGTSTQQPAPSSTVQELSAGGVAAPVHAAATPSTTAAAPQAAEAPKHTGSTAAAATGLPDTGSTEPVVSEPRSSVPAKPEEGTTKEPHPAPATSKPIPGLSATSGPLDDSPAHGYADMTDAPKTIEHPVGEGEVADDPPFATPMEAPEAATLGKTKNMGTAEEFTKTA